MGMSWIVSRRPARPESRARLARTRTEFDGPKPDVREAAVAQPPDTLPFRDGPGPPADLNERTEKGPPRQTDEQQAARLQHAYHFGEGPARLRQMFENVCGHHQVEGPVRVGNRKDVGLLEC